MAFCCENAGSILGWGEDYGCNYITLTSPRLKGEARRVSAWLRID
jgi:hypothetical protein